eukprot:TRINITY_DN3871_c0_g2_i2.p1 TRINITY_DN3871_c0_g2~~TRINITY_DN3871_c0_g2_i2.p1  ORF type:complete len:303 (-),score=53.62 TRINITY_DN3871_c0_g2_i2:237-1145(-)
MPVTGLPAAVETTLSALLAENSVSSWKIAGEGVNTVVVLRLKPVDPEVTTTNMAAEPVLNRNTQVQYYRRKPPSQVRRDQERAKQQKGKVTDRQHDAGVPVLNAVCLDDTRVELPSFTSCDVQHAQTTHSEDETGVSQTTDDFEPQCANIGEPQCASGLSLHLPDINQVQTIDSTVGGFDSRVVKSYVARLTTRLMQRRLRDSHRNKTFRKTVVYDSGSEKVLMCESDDIVLEYTCHSDSNHSCVYWFLKQDEKHMLAEECVKLSNLRKRGKPIDNTEHGELQARAERGLETLHSLIQFYLG